MTDIAARAAAPRDVRIPPISKIKDWLNEYVDAVARRRPEKGIRSENCIKDNGRVGDGCTRLWRNLSHGGFLRCAMQHR